MKKYYATYCTMDGRLANPLWHACLLLSEQLDENEKIEVKKAFGFYPGKMTSPDVNFSQPETLLYRFAYELKKKSRF